MSYPIIYDSTSKKLSVENSNLYPELIEDINQLNVLSAEIVAFGDVPPIPNKDNFNKQLTLMIKKMHESGQVAFKNGNYKEATKHFTVGLGLVSKRAKYESFQIALQEMGLLLMSRCDSYLKNKEYVSAFSDADMLLGLQINTPDNFLRRGVCNFFLENYEAAKADYERGLAFDPNNSRLKLELGVALQKIRNENQDP